MRAAEFMIEDSASDQSVRALARRVQNAAIRAPICDMVPAAITFSRGSDVTIIPVCYTTTILPNVLIGLISRVRSAAALDLRVWQTTIPQQYEYMIVFPYGRDSDVCRILDRFPQNDEEALTVARKLFPSSTYLRGRIEDRPETFLHEFIHVMDFMRAAERGVILKPKTNAQNGEHGYVNSPLERNAYYHEVFVWLDKKGRAWFQRPFRDVLKSVVALMDRNFWVHLDEANRRRLISRLYAFWQDKQAKTSES